MATDEPFFKIGDVVRLLGSDVNMTVYYVSGSNIQTFWFSTTNLLQQGCFSPKVLQKRRTA